MASIESYETAVHARRGTLIDHGAPMMSKPYIEAGIAVAVTVLGPLAFAGYIFKFQKPPGRLALIDQTSANACVERVDQRTNDAAAVARAKAILIEIEEAPREERLRLWKELDGLRCRSDSVRPFLFDFAYNETSGAEPYPRFVAAATIAGFGRPSRIGPNSLKDTALGLYVRIQRGLPVYGPRRLELDPALNDLKVTVAPNAKNDLTFTEILWTILVDYKLSFRLDRTETFVIYPPPPLAWAEPGLGRQG